LTVSRGLFFYELRAMTYELYCYVAVFLACDLKGKGSYLT
jgi:hypothetical protein